MKRTLVTKEDLRAWFTTELQKHEGCEECSIGPINRLAEPDELGCNWSDTITLRVSDAPKEVYLAAFTEVVREAPHRFHLG